VRLDKYGAIILQIPSQVLSKFQVEFELIKNTTEFTTIKISPKKESKV
jgi:hypothetical protein